MDGQLLDTPWTTGTWQSMNQLTVGPLGLGASARFKTYADSQYLYVGVQASKAPATLYSGPTLWLNDSIELYFDMDNAHTTTYNPANDFHYTFGWNNPTPLVSAGGSLAGVVYAYFNTGSGWSAEIAIPWTALGVTPSPGALYGFDAAVNFASASETRQCQLTWHSATATNYQDTSQFGELQMGAACPPMSPTSTPSPAPTSAATFTPTPVTRGATLPYTELEAENAVVSGGSILTANRNVGTIAAESSGRRAVQLNATGNKIDFNGVPGFNAIVVRYVIPDSAGGGGTTATLSLYINGAFVQKLNLTSKYAWAYGGWAIPYNQSPSGGSPVHYYDEVRALLPSSYAAGSTVTLQRDASDTASWYVVDLIDLEQVAPALAQPANSLSAASYGAVPNDGGDDTTALQNLINAAQAQGKVAYIPAGTYELSSPLSIPAVAVQGAGMWYTTLHQNNDTSGLRVNAGGGSFFVGDLSLLGEVTNRVDSNTDSGLDQHGGNGSQLARVWIEHFKCGWWVGNTGATTNNLTVTGCRIRDTYADGINLCNGSSNSTITNCNFRNTGDDSIASWSPSANAPNTNNTFSFNTVQLPWRANCIAVYGGTSNHVQDNMVSDTLDYPGILLAQEFTSTTMAGTTTCQRNTLLRCGGPFGGTNHGAFKISTAQGAVNGIQASDLDILDSSYAAVFVAGGNPVNSTSFTNFNINTANTAALQTAAGTGGTINCTNVVATGTSGLSNAGGLNFVKVSGNAGW